MKKILCLIFACCLIYTQAFGAVFIDTTESGITVLLFEDFESGVSCATGGWTVSGTPDCQATDYKDGNYGLKFSDTGNIAKSFTNQTVVYCKLDMRVSALDYYNYLFYIRDGSTLLGRLRIDDGGNIDFYYDSDSDTAHDIVACSVDTWYTIKIRYQCDTGGSTGSLHVWATTGQNQTLPTSLAAADVIVTGITQSTTPSINDVRFNGKALMSTWFDNIIVSTGDPDA